MRPTLIVILLVAVAALGASDAAGASDCTRFDETAHAAAEVCLEREGPRVHGADLDASGDAGDLAVAGGADAHHNLFLLGFGGPGGLAAAHAAAGPTAAHALVGLVLPSVEDDGGYALCVRAGGDSLACERGSLAYVPIGLVLLP